MPASLRLLLIVLVVAAVAYGAVGTWTVIQHASAAQDVVSTSEPLSLAAQRMYQALSDADVTATTAFLAGRTCGCRPASATPPISAGPLPS